MIFWDFIRLNLSLNNNIIDSKSWITIFFLGFFAFLMTILFKFYFGFFSWVTDIICISWASLSYDSIFEVVLLFNSYYSFIFYLRAFFFIINFGIFKIFLSFNICDTFSFVIFSFYSNYFSYNWEQLILILLLGSTK